MHEGNVVEQGTHQELISAGGRYADLHSLSEKISRTGEQVTEADIPLFLLTSAAPTYPIQTAPSDRKYQWQHSIPRKSCPYITGQTHILPLPAPATNLCALKTANSSWSD